MIIQPDIGPTCSTPMAPTQRHASSIFKISNYGFHAGMAIALGAFNQKKA
jgi:hypothetical protein